MYIHCLKIVNQIYVCVNGPLAQSVQRGANKGKVVSSKHIPIRSPFLCGGLSF